jgi:hypothetical protein
MSRRLVLLLALACVTTAALAAAWVPIQQRLTPAQMHATGLDTLRPDQLALLDQLLGDEPARAANDAAEPSVAGPHGGAAAQARSNDPNRYAGLAETPIHTRYSGTVASWAPGTEFKLDNGQVWKVLKGEMKLRKPLVSPEVVLVPGFAGRWFLQLDEDLPKARVYRID